MGKALGTKKQILSKVRKNSQARKIWSEVDVLIIQEASMASAFLLDIIDFLGREIRREPVRAFGGIQVILIGDIYGLLPPPSTAICCPDCGQTHKISTVAGASLQQVGYFLTCSNTNCNLMFLNSWILFPFESGVWDEAKFTYVPLTVNYESDNGIASVLDEFSRAAPFSERGAAFLKSISEKKTTNMEVRTWFFKFSLR
jgi:hypothetical protein